MPQIIIKGASEVPAGTNPSNAQQSTRSRAIAALMGQNTGQAEQPPVQNQNSVTAEEMPVVKATTETPEAQTDGQTHTNEGTSEPSKEETRPKEEPLSAQYAQLARKEKAMRAEMQKLKAERAAFKAEQEAVAKPSAPSQSFDPAQYVAKDRLAKDPLGVLSENGLTYEQITQLALNQPSPETQQLYATIDELKSEIKSLRDDTTSTKQSIQDAQAQSYKQALNQIRSDVTNMVNTRADDFETIKETRQVDAVVELIERTFKEEGYVMELEDAAKAVEEELFEQSLKLARLKKIQAKLKPATETPTTQKQENTQQKQAPKTLTNTIGSQRPLTARERAIMAARGELKS